MKKLVVFDVDGTILDSFGLYERAVAVYSEENNLPFPDVTAIKRGYGDPYNHDFRWGVSREEQVQHLWKSFAMIDDWSKSGEPDKTPGFFDGVHDLLTELKDTGHTLAIVTSKPEAPLLHLLEYHRAHSFFSAHRTWDDIKRRGEKEKPHPDMLESVMRDLRFVPDETVMIGDTTMDIRMGRTALSHTIGVTWGTHLKEDLLSAGAHHLAEEHTSSLMPLIRKIFS